MKHYRIIIRRQDGTEYECDRIASNEEMAMNMVKVPDQENVVEIIRNFSNEEKGGDII